MKTHEYLLLLLNGGASIRQAQIYLQSRAEAGELTGWGTYGNGTRIEGAWFARGTEWVRHVSWFGWQAAAYDVAMGEPLADSYEGWGVRIINGKRIAS